MTSEDMERAIEFLLQSQANLETQIAETNRIVRLQAETQTELIQIVTRHIESQVDINARTDERINKLAATVERLIGGRGDS